MRSMRYGMPAERRFLTTDELAARWRCSTEAVLRRRRRGVIPEPVRFLERGGFVWPLDIIESFENEKVSERVCNVNLSRKKGNGEGPTQRHQETQPRNQSVS